LNVSTFERQHHRSRHRTASACRNKSALNTRTANGGLVSLPYAVEAIADELLQNVEVDPRDLAQRLATDLLQRADGTDAARRELVRCGLAADAHSEMLRAAELRHLHRADPELVRLQDEASGILGQLVAQADGLPVDDLRARFQAAEAEQRERIVELRIRPRLNLATASSTRKAAQRLRQLRDLDRLLTHYEVHDDRLRLLEGCLAWIDREWDQLVNMEEEIARGK
jgi:hypothetical protein